MLQVQIWYVHCQLRSPYIEEIFGTTCNLHLMDRTQIFKIVNFIPLREWTWHYCVSYVTHAERHTLFSFCSETWFKVTLLKCWHAFKDVCLLSYHDCSQSGIKFRNMNIYWLLFQEEQSLDCAILWTVRYVADSVVIKTFLADDSCTEAHFWKLFNMLCS